MRPVFLKLLVLAIFLVPFAAIFLQPPVHAAGESGVCNFAGSEKVACNKCMGDATKAWTALGCIDTNPSALIQQVLPFGIGIGGGIAFLLILIGGLQIMTSAGNPERLNAGRELVTSSITGLMLIILSIFILRLIGVEILAIPDFN